jgi:hypothetical protein
MRIKDDDKSFEMGRILRAKRNKQLGLLSMEGNELKWSTALFALNPGGQGITVQLEMPFAHVQKDTLKNLLKSH